MYSCGFQLFSETGPALPWKPGGMKAPPAEVNVSKYSYMDKRTQSLENTGSSKSLLVGYVIQLIYQGTHRIPGPAADGTRCTW